MSIDLSQLFANLQGQLARELEGVRATVSHPGAVGSDSEEGWRHMLAEYLPRRYSVSKAFVIDSRGALSEEIDLVLYDRQYSPFLLKHRSSLYIPAESVYAVLEVKQRLNRRNVAAACQKAASVRALHRTSAPIVHAGGRIDETKKPFRLLAGLVALGSDWTPAYAAPFRQAWEAAPPEGQLDLVCSLGQGTADIRIAEDGRPQFAPSPPDRALLTFFLRLVARLQELGTAPALDLAEYEKALR